MTAAVVDPNTSWSIGNQRELSLGVETGRLQYYDKHSELVERYTC